MIPCPDPTAEDSERSRHQDRGQYLARQDRWGDLADEIRAADTNRLVTPGGMPVADLLSYGARADVVLAVEHALYDGSPAHGAPLLQGIEALEGVLAEFPDDYAIAVLVAQAHMDIGWFWRGTGWDHETPARNLEAFQAHFDRAVDILDVYAEADLDAPILAAARCSLLCGRRDAGARIANDYERLINLNPLNPGPMRAMGNYLLPRWFGSYDQLELEARRTAARTQAVWGAGAYTWVMFDAITVDESACAHLDLEFFIEGLRDILERAPHQHTVNLLAAYCANSHGQTFTGNDAADHIRAQIADCADWIVREHLVELHPMIWAHAAAGFDNNLAIRFPRRFAAAGQADALRFIARLFRREIAQGKRITFTANGPVADTG